MSDSLNLRSLLPPNATELEQALEVSMDYPLNPEAVKAYPIDLSSCSPALFSRYQLGELIPWLSEDNWPSPGEALHGQRCRGTPKALRLALGWLNLTDIVIEDDLKNRHFAEYQCGVNAAVLSDHTIKRLIGLSDWASPVRSRCRRIYNNGYDYRYFVLSDSPWGDPLSEDSGVTFMTDDDSDKSVLENKNDHGKKSAIKKSHTNTQASPAKKSLTVSFGRAHHADINIPYWMSDHHASHTGFTVSFNDDQRLDAGRLDAPARVFSQRMLFSTQERERVVEVPANCVAGSWHHDFILTHQQTLKSGAHGQSH